MEDIRKTLIEISQIDINDGVVFEFQSAEPIMEEHDYPGIRFGINALFEGTKQHFAIDISTDDIITPDVKYPLSNPKQKAEPNSMALKVIIAMCSTNAPRCFSLIAFQL